MVLMMVYIENSKKANEIDGFERGETKKRLVLRGFEVKFPFRLTRIMLHKS